MKITKKTLQKIIKEEVSKYVKEQEEGVQDIESESADKIEEDFQKEAKDLLDSMIGEGGVYYNRYKELANKKVEDRDKIEIGDYVQVATDKIRLSWGVEPDTGKFFVDARQWWEVPEPNRRSEGRWRPIKQRN